VFDVFALSSDSEGLPLCLAEAMSVGLPLVCTAVGGVPLVVDEGETGLLVPRGDEAALRAALSRFASDPGLARLMGKRAQEVAAQRYSAERMMSEYLELYGARAGALGFPRGSSGAQPPEEPPVSSTVDSDPGDSPASLSPNSMPASMPRSSRRAQVKS
jgi:hypothetical protein